MSTRGVIARPTEDGGWSGTYLHFDSYPSGAGKALWTVYHGEAQGDAADMLRFYIDEHPGGWSTTRRRAVAPDDPLDEPERFWSRGRYPGTCYCHRADNGQRGPEPDMPVTSDGDHCGTEYAYILDAQRKTMTVAAWDSALRCWRTTGVVDLEGPEPDWRAFWAP